MATAATGKAESLPVRDSEIRAQVEDFYARYAEAICDGDLEAWPDFFVEDCLYHLKPRTNHERGMMLGPIFSDSRGALIDRVTAIRNSMVFAPRAVCYVVGTIRVAGIDGGIARTRSMFSAYHTLEAGDSDLLMVGRTFDRIALGDEPKFVERVVVFDTERVPGALIYPV